MKSITLLSVSLLILTGCMGMNGETRSYSSSNLRAPTSQPYQNAAKAAEASMPQSITQPLNINPLPATATTTTTPVSPQQPLVQTIVIPQYTPQPAGMLPYGTAGYVNPNTLNVPPFVSTPQVPMTSSNQIQMSVAPQNQMMQPSGANQSKMTQAQIAQQPQIQLPGTSIHLPNTPIKGSNFVDKKNGDVVTENVYPVWASSDFDAKKFVKEDKLVYFKNPNRNETVQCNAVDVMCIASYQQQGYLRTDGIAETRAPISASQPAISTMQNNGGGYPKTDWDEESIPRW